MPLVPFSSYRPPAWAPGGHLQTVLPALTRQVPHVTTEGERLELEDGDFLDLEWSNRGRERLAILSHGLEASTQAGYMQGMACALVEAGWDVLAWNFRGCSGELNRLPQFYHSGATDDLAAVIGHAEKIHPARRLDLVGFSLGGNMTLKYLGESRQRPSNLGRAIVFSVPCDLAAASKKLESRSNRILYMRRFIQSLSAKVRAKHPRYPEQLDPAGLEGVTTFRQFDNRYTAPLHGFRDAEHYWARSSSRQFLPGIGIPTLLVNAANDPFLAPACFPAEEAEASTAFHLEIPSAGGHVGFPGEQKGFLWSERRAVEFLLTEQA